MFHVDIPIVLDGSKKEMYLITTKKERGCEGHTEVNCGKRLLYNIPLMILSNYVICIVIACMFIEESFIRICRKNKIKNPSTNN